jgi:hypothetical protein
LNEPCTQVRTLMPWLLNGSLKNEEIVMTLDHIRDCDACKRELVFLATTAKVASNTWTEAPTRAFLGRLWTRLEQQTQMQEIKEIQEMGEMSESTDGQIPGASVKRGLFRTTVRTVGYMLTPLGFARDVVQLAYESILREFGQRIAGLTH